MGDGEIIWKDKYLFSFCFCCLQGKWQAISFLELTSALRSCPYSLLLFSNLWVLLSVLQFLYSCCFLNCPLPLHELLLWKSPGTFSVAKGKWNSQSFIVDSGNAVFPLAQARTLASSFTSLFLLDPYSILQEMLLTLPSET